MELYDDYLDSSLIHEETQKFSNYLSALGLWDIRLYRSYRNNHKAGLSLQTLTLLYYSVFIFLLSVYYHAHSNRL